MAAIRDVAIIILAFESILIGALLIILVIQVYLLVRLLKNEIRPIIDSTQETVGTVRGTASFVGDHLAKPMIEASSYASGVRQAVRALRSFRRKPRPE